MLSKHKEVFNIISDQRKKNQTTRGNPLYTHLANSLCLSTNGEDVDL